MVESKVLGQTMFWWSSGRPFSKICKITGCQGLLLLCIAKQGIQHNVIPALP